MSLDNSKKSNMKREKVINLNFSYYNLIYMFILGILIAILLLLMIMVIHEAGHFFVARAFGMQTPAVGLGLPFAGPTILLGEYDHVRYRLHPLLPFGAYVAIPEMDDESVHELESFGLELTGPLRQFAPWQKIIVSLAGPLANIVSAFLFLWLMVTTVGVIHADQHRIIITKLTEQANASVIASIHPQDQILKLNNKQITSHKQFIDTLQSNSNHEMPITVLRQGREYEFKVKTNAEGKLGISIMLEPSNITKEKIQGKNAFTRQLKAATDEFDELCGFSWKSIVMLVSAPVKAVMGQDTGFKASELHGIVEITKDLAKVFDQQAYLLIRYWAMLSIYIGMINLLPILPLDGGNILFQTIEIFIKDNHIIKKIKDLYTQAGLILVYSLLILVMVNDLGLGKLIWH